MTTEYKPLYEINSARRALYTIQNQRTNGFAVCLFGGYWVSHDTPRMWRLMHHTTPLNDFVAVGTPTQIVAAWQRALVAQGLGRQDSDKRFDRH